MISGRGAASEFQPAEAQLRAVLEVVDSGVAVFDESGRLLVANDRLSEILGLSQDAATDSRLLEVRLKGLAENFRDPRAFNRQWEEHRHIAQESLTEELEMLRPVHTLIERRSRPVWDADGRRVGWLEVYRDVTSQREARTTLLQTEKMAALGQLVSGIAHELNNPLTSILGYAQLLQSRGMRFSRTADARRIYEEASRASRIVKNLLFFARQAKLERTPVHLNEVVERSLALRGYELKVENIEVELALDPELPLVLADATQMQQVVFNLVVNAEQAIQQGRGAGKIRVATRAVAPSRIALEISDDGPGIQPEIVSRVFDPFFTTKAVGIGTGLGLSIVYGIVQEHGGEICVDTQPGRGAKFVIELPVAGAETLSSSPRESVSQTAIPQQGTLLSSLRALVRTGRRVLVVEDEPTVAQLIDDVLSDEGHLVDTVLDSREALSRIANHEYDLVVCDLRMPHLDGQAFYRALVQAGSPLQNHLVIVTGDTMAPHTHEFLERSRLPYVAKPFLVEELKLAVGRALAGLTPSTSEHPGRAALPKTQNEAKKR